LKPIWDWTWILTPFLPLRCTVFTLDAGPVELGFLVEGSLEILGGVIGSAIEKMLSTLLKSGPKGPIAPAEAPVGDRSFEPCFGVFWVLATPS